MGNISIKKIIFPFLILIFVPHYLLSQVRVLNEELDGQTYKITVEVNNRTKEIYKENGINRIKFSGFGDEGKPGSFILPTSDIFIAIPEGSEPNLTIDVLEREEISAIPEINYEPFLQNDSIVSYRKVDEIIDIKSKAEFKIIGYLWLEDEYCLHLKLNEFIYLPEHRSTIANKKFIITLNFEGDKNIVNLFERRDSNTYQRINSAILSTKFFPIITNRQRITFEETNNDWINYGDEYVKLAVNFDGIARVYGSDLSELGIDLAEIDPATIKLILRGVEIPVFVSDGALNVFEENDYIEFIGCRNYSGHHRETSEYNTPYNEYLDRYSEKTIYWLTWGREAGVRTNTTLDYTVYPQDSIRYFDEFIHIEENPWMDYSTDNLVRRQFPDWIENETWIWWTQGVGTRNLNVTLENIYGNEPAKAFVKIQSQAGDIKENTHQFGIKINNDPTVFDQSFFDRYTQKVLKAEFNSDLLNNGINTIKLVSFATEASLNAIFGDWYEIEYPRQLIFNGDSLGFGFRNLDAEKFAEIIINNVIDTGDLVLYKTFSDSEYQRIDNYKFDAGVLTFPDTVQNGIKYYLINENKIPKPEIIYQKNFVQLIDPNLQVDYILITHPDFINSANEYSRFIEEEYELSTKVVNVFDIYDEFNFGFYSPEPIREFLKNAYNVWQEPKPEYLFLVGDANYDYHKNSTIFRGIPEVIDFVPSYGIPQSDTWFVCWNETDVPIPSMNVGRLPVKNNDEFNYYFNKHRNHLARPFDKANKNYLLFSGGKGDNESELISLRAVNENIQSIIESFPIGGKSNHFYKTISPKSDFGPLESQFNNLVSAGANFISYIGHSGVQIWDNSIVLPSQLSNSVNINPLITDFGCSTGKFGEPEIISFAELFINEEDGQAINYIGNASLGFTSTSTTFPILFYENLLHDSLYNVGNIHRESKIEMIGDYGSSDANYVFTLCNTLFGDPVVKLRIPDKVDFSISNELITIIDEKYSDKSDSLGLSIKYYNYGKVYADSFYINIEQIYENESIYTRTLKLPIPLFVDSVRINFPIADKSGAHTVRVNLDYDQKHNELYENNNITQFNLIVPSYAVKPLLTSNVYNSRLEEIKLLNPSYSNYDLERLMIDVDVAPDFDDSQSIVQPIDTFMTTISLGNLIENARYYIRAKEDIVNSEYSSTISFINVEGPRFYIGDSNSIVGHNYESLRMENGSSLVLGDVKNVLQVFSAGFNDGKTALGIINGANYMEESGSIGHHIAIFDEATLQFEEYHRYNLLFDGVSAVNAYIAKLDAIPENKIVLFAICDEGSSRLSATLKNKIKEFGSVLIDSVGWRYAWVMIGKKNSIPGTVPEKFGKTFEGIISIDTTIIRPNNFGRLVTTQIGPASKWEKLNVAINEPENSSIIFKPIGINISGVQDTLDQLTFVDGIANLSTLNNFYYPYIQILSEFNASDNGASPSLSKLGVDYTGVPELGTNYQVTWLERDTLDQGEDANLSFYVYNVGETVADSFTVQVDIVNPDNTHEKIFEQLVDSLGVEQRKLFEVNYNTASFSGAKSFFINIDSGDDILELYEDNNFYTMPFYVVGDTTRPSLKLTFDGADIFDGDYISPNPEIKIELSDESLLGITDTSVVKLYLNNQPVYFADNIETISYSFSNANPKFTVEYRPHLEDGEYVFKVMASDAVGNLVDSAGTTKSFLVEENTKLLYVYNYPNPFADDTYFTFKLTQVPDELRIKIYTIAGRLIKEIKRGAADLNFDFNRIYWDGRDEDGDLVANGVYLYKIIISKDGESQNVTQKLAIIR